MPDPRGISSAIAQALAAPAVAAAGQERATRIMRRAQTMAANAGAVEFAKALRVETGVRPGAQSPHGAKRPYARETADITDEMTDADRGSRMSRNTIMRRASRA